MEMDGGSIDPKGAVGKVDAMAFTAVRFGAVVVVCARSVLRLKFLDDEAEGVEVVGSSRVAGALGSLRCFLARRLRHSGRSQVVVLVVSLW